MSTGDKSASSWERAVELFIMRVWGNSTDRSAVECERKTLQKAMRQCAEAHAASVTAERDAIQAKLADIESIRGQHDCGCEVCSTISLVCPATSSSYALEILALRAKVDEFRKEVMPRSEFLDLLEERDNLKTRVQWFLDNGGSYTLQLENRLDEVEAERDALRAEVERLKAQVPPIFNPPGGWAIALVPPKEGEP